MYERFRDRRDAGLRLAGYLETHLSERADIVLALPRGGVPVAFEIASRLHLPLQVFVVRKLGVPGHEEFAMGAIASGGDAVLNEEVIDQLHVPYPQVQAVIEKEGRELKRREAVYNAERRERPIEGKSIILVDDGLATGSTMKVAVHSVKRQGARRVAVAVPVAPASVRFEFEAIADEFICLIEPEVFFAVGQWYEDFSQTTDQEVQEFLRMEPVI